VPRQTPSQTIGPYFKIGLTRDGQNVLVSEATEGERIRIEGRVLDGAGEPVRDAIIEIWQANAHGRYDHPDDTQDKPLDAAFGGFGRAATDDEGAYWFETVKPGQVPGPGNALQAPHIGVAVFARGMLRHAYSRIYFAGEAANEIDPLLNAIDDTRHRATLVAENAGADGNGASIYRFDIVLQGANETVFLDI
jgi:protocatechuate 3,4-dioxygenase alpha subunit